MKLSKNFVKDYVDIDVDIKDLAEDMTRVGNEYDSAEKLVNATKLIIGEVKECEMHPDSDHLHVCKVDIGKEILDIVCGAPNVRKGLKVIVAQVGAELPGDITIRKGNIRGQESNGMMCSLLELGIESKYLSEAEKNGIHELPQDAPVGEDPIKFMGLDDEVADFELTANRGDLLSILGMAYELGAIYDKPVKEIDLKHSEENEDVNDSFNVEIETENCNLFLAKKALNVTIKESPDFIKNRLIASGIRPINNVVDISNYVMLEVGQPLHFYDADRLGNKILVRMAKNGEKLTTLDNIERELDQEDIVITNGTEAIGLAGVMGGLSTEVEEDTKNIIIESAIFDGVKIRCTSKKILRSEASNRFEKGLDPNRTYMAIERAVALLEKYADAKIAKGTVVYDKANKEAKKIDISFEDINNLLGIVVPDEATLDVFRKLGFEYKVNGRNVTVTVPTRRMDISIKEDLIEEVGRIYGVDNIEGKLPMLPTRTGKYDKTTREIRNKMIGLGLNETMSYILINDKEVSKFTTDNFEPIKLLDPLTEERNTLRYSMIPSLLKIYNYNLGRNNKDVSIFEIGKGFGKVNEDYIEEEKLCVLMSGKYYEGIGNTKNVDFYILKGVAEELLDYLGYNGRYSFINNKELPKEMHPGQSALISVNNDTVGIMGKVHPKESKEDIYVMEINLSKLLAKKVGKMKYKEFSKFPSIKKDVAFIVDKNLESATIEKQIKKSAGSLLTNIEVFDVYTGEHVDENKKSIAYSLTFSDSKKTLTDDEVTGIFNKVIADAERVFGAEIRK